MGIIDLTNIIHYDGEKNRLNIGEDDANKLFTNGYGYNFDENIMGSVFQLGWDSVVMLVGQSGKLQIVKAEYLDNGQFKEVEGAKDLRFDMVMTRAVDTCTFIHLNQGNKHVLCHLDSDTEQKTDVRGLKLKELSDGLNGGSAFVTMIKGEEYYINQLTGQTKITAKCRTINNLSYIRKKIPEKVEFYESCADIINNFGHLEIGLKVTDTGVQLYGDVTNRFRGDGVIPCYRFLGINGFNTALINLLEDFN